MKTTSKTWTYKDYQNLEDDKRYEIIEGELIEMPSPKFIHQEISANLIIELGNYIKKRNLGKIIAARMDVILSNINTVQPDVLFISNENSHIIQDKIFGSPDLLIEILSPTNPLHDKEIKYQLYQKYKIREYWIVDSDNKTFEVYTLDNDQYKLFHQGDHVKSMLFNDFNLMFSQLED